MKRARWSLRRARVLLGTKFLLIAGLVGYVVVAWLAELIAGLHTPVDLGPLLAGLFAGIPAVLKARYRVVERVGGHDVLQLHS